MSRPAANLPSSPGLPSVEELVRVLDVAGEARRRREAVDKLWDGETARGELRATLIDAAAMTEEPLTDEQADAAVEWYFERLHRFKEPPSGLKTTLYRFYTRRGPFVWIGCVLLLAAAAWLFYTLRLDLSGERAAVEATINEVRNRLTTPDPRIDVESWARDASRYAEEGNAAALGRIGTQAAGIRDQITDAFDVHVVGLTKLPNPRVGAPLMSPSLILEATGPDGRPFDVTVHDVGYGVPLPRSRWGQEVSRPVYERVLALQKNGRPLPKFAVKRAGELDWDIKLLDEDGDPVRFGKQLADPVERTP